MGRSADSMNRIEKKLDLLLDNAGVQYTEDKPEPQQPVDFNEDNAGEVTHEEDGGNIVTSRGLKRRNK